MSTIFRKPTAASPSPPPSPFARPEPEPWWQRSIDLPKNTFAYLLLAAVVGFFALLVYGTWGSPGPVDDGQRGSALVCSYTERNGLAVGTCQERR